MEPLGTDGELLRRLPGLERLWRLTRGRSDVVIAVLDGLSSDAVGRQSLAPAGPAMEHGSHVVSLLAGSANGVVSGIAPSATLVEVPIFFDRADGTGPACTQENLAAAIETALDRGAAVINISAAQIGDLLTLSTGLSLALQRAERAEAMVVAAAGNHGCACDTVPAAVASVLAVGAVDDGGVPLALSNHGEAIRQNGIQVLGKDLPAACADGRLCRVTGTSFAAAIVSGVCALVLSVARDRGLNPSAASLRQIMRQSMRSTAGGDADPGDRRGALDLNSVADHLENWGVTAMSAEHGTREATQLIEAVPAADGLVEAAGCSCGGGEGAKEGATEGAKGDCGCGGGKAPPLVYAIGRLGISFPTLTRRDSIWRQINGFRREAEGVTPEVDLRPITNENLKDLFATSPNAAESVVWTLSRSEVPMYAIVPYGAFAYRTYEWIVREWADPTVEFISLPGKVAGKVKLYDGFEVDAVVPDLRGMFSWSKSRYVGEIVRLMSEAGVAEAVIADNVARFLGKIFFKIRNRGLAPEERALNAAATNAFNVTDVVAQAGAEGLAFKDISIERSPISRPGSEYYDVLMTFFDPKKRLEVAPLLARFTVDVSDTVPVVVGEPVVWYEY